MGWVDVIADDGVSWHRNSVGRYPSNFKTNPGYHGIVGRTTKRTAFATGVKIKGRSAPQPAFDKMQAMSRACRWRKERGARVQGSRPLDELKVQAPCVARVPAGGYRLFYTGLTCLSSAIVTAALDTLGGALLKSQSFCPGTVAARVIRDMSVY